MGPDGSGKTTIAKKLKKKLKKNFIKFQYIHLVPTLLKPIRTNPVTDPSFFTDSLLYWEMLPS